MKDHHVAELRPRTQGIVGTEDDRERVGQGEPAIEVSKTPRSNRGDTHGHPATPEEAEETRIAYVALTRARRLCRVALPDTTPTDIVELFTAGGFQRRTQ